MKHSEQIEKVIERRRLFCEALRSGHYIQARRAYYKEGAFCVLGLHAYLFEGATPAALYSDQHDMGPCTKRLGLAGLYEVLVLNDDKKLSFPEIADWLESQPIHIAAAEDQL